MGLTRRQFLAGSGLAIVSSGCGMLSRRLLMAGGSSGGFTPPPGPLTQYRAALAARASSPVNIVCIGDSITEGYYASSLANRWPEQVLTALDGLYGSGGNVSVYRATAWGDNAVPPLTLPWTVVTPDRGDDFGLGRKFDVVGSGSSTSLTIAAVSTGFSIVYTRGPAASTFGSFDYTVDGGAPTTVSAVNATVQGGRLATVSGLSLASHTVVVTPNTLNVPIEGIIFYNGNETNGIRVWEGGHSGFRGADYVDPTKPHWIDLLSNITASLVVIMLGRNEWVASDGTASYIANLTTLIANVRATATPAPSVLLVAEMQGNYVTGTLWSTYVTALAGLVASDGDLAYIDLNAAFGGYTVPPSGSLYNADLKHPSAAGETEIATEVLALIG